eukprot:m.197644 g.197644  ORF g.197644 m.197644 type:complete len:52 (+) comp53767_c0_seq11:299-454(+)
MHEPVLARKFEKRFSVLQRKSDNRQQDANDEIHNPTEKKGASTHGKKKNVR